MITMGMKSAFSRRPLVLAVAGIFAMGSFGACSTITSTIDVIQQLERAGFDDVSLRSTSDNVVDVEYRESALRNDTESFQEDSQEIAELVWREYRLRIDGIYVADATSRNSHFFPRSELVARFGARNEAYDDKTMADETERIGRLALIGLAVAGNVFLGLVALIVWLVVRSSRKRQRRQGPPPGAGGPGFSGDLRYGAPGSPAGWQPPQGGPAPGWQPPPAPGSGLAPPPTGSAPGGQSLPPQPPAAPTTGWQPPSAPGEPSSGGWQPPQQQ